ncbi:MAG: nucleotidyltransferase domain-containing protein [Bacteroidetes bacterium]|nr:MAG: nucleotidyltransferase domain-containing protein [Bacteroidota bacterium]
MSDSKNIHPEILKMVKEYLQELNKNGIKITRAILYGSYARSEQNENSDIDLLLISPLFDNGSNKYAGKIWQLTKVSDYKIEPIAVGEKRFLEDDATPLLEIARTEGIEIALP